MPMKFARSDVGEDGAKAAESGIKQFDVALERIPAPLPSTLKTYQASIARFVATESGVIEALEKFDDPVACGSAKETKAITDNADDPEQAGDQQNDALGHLSGLRTNIAPGAANTDLLSPFADYRPAEKGRHHTGEVVAGVGALGTFVLSSLTALGLGPVAAVVGGLAVAAMVAAAILRQRRYR